VYAEASHSVCFDGDEINNWISPAPGLGNATPTGSGVSIGFLGDFGDDERLSRNQEFTTETQTTQR
jgi:hypothetical protein